MFYVKILLMIVLCITPFVYAYYIRPKTKTSKVWRNIFTVLSNKLPSFDIIVSSMKNIRERFAEGLANHVDLRIDQVYVHDGNQQRERDDLRG